MDAVVDFTSQFEGEFTQALRYHNLLMNIDSCKNNLLNTRIIEKDDMTIAKTDSGHLTQFRTYISENDINDIALSIQNLYEVASNNHSKFLYVGIANKEYHCTLPVNAVNHSKTNYDRFINALKFKNVPLLDLTAMLVEENFSYNEIFFKTDHHWKPHIGFRATTTICDALKDKYGFEYNEAYTDLNNFNVKTHEDRFLGSYGQKAGLFFTWEGAEDIDIITPKFKTDLTAEQPFKNTVKRGEFHDVLIDKRFIEARNYYNSNAYATYTGGDFELQIIKNNLNPNGKKVLVIRDSFACVVTPFLSLNTNELHVLDMRDFANISGQRINVYDYIQKENPDYVVVLYSGVLSIEKSNKKYDFE